MSDPATLLAARYVSLATYRRDGREVCTPIWLAGIGTTGYAFSAGHAGKVKRIRANGRARLATCTANGRVTGPWRDARARILTRPEEIAAAYAALRAKYGWAMWLLDVLARLTGRYPRRALIAIELD